MRSFYFCQNAAAKSVWLTIYFIEIKERGEGKMAEKRTIRTKVRMTDDEVFVLRKIADEQHTTMSNILRESTLEKPYEKIIDIKNDDLHELISLVSTFDNSIRTFADEAEKTGSNFASYIKMIQDNTHEVDDDYAELRKLVERRRTKVGKAVAGQLKSRLAGVVYDFHDGYSTRGNALSIYVSEGEIEKIRELADKENCSISCLLKTNAIELYKGGRITIQSNDLSELNKRIKHEQRFINAVLQGIKGRAVDDDDIDSIANSVDSIREWIQAELAEVSVENSPVKEEAKEVVRKRKR